MMSTAATPEQPSPTETPAATPEEPAVDAQAAAPLAPEVPAAPQTVGTGFAGHVKTIALLTLISRAAGLMRESLAFKVFGNGAVWSAWGAAFVLPNTFRRLFGEGALTAAFLPEYTALLKTDRAMAGKLASLTMAAMLGFAGLLTVIGEVVLWVVLARMAADAPGRDAVVFTMVMLPYMPLICATAVLGGMLQVNGSFIAPAASPILFNGCMIAAQTVSAWWFNASDQTTAMMVAVSVTVSGLVQLGWCLWGLRGMVAWSRVFTGVRQPVTRMFKRFIPVTISMGTLQLGVIADQIIASYPVTVGPRLPWGTLYPIDAGGNAVLGYASRLYQFPLGVFGIAVATAVFPALARDFGERLKFASTLRHGVRLSLFIGIPATVGLALVNNNLCSVIYSSKASHAAEVERISRALLGYLPAVWAYSLTHVFTRAFYAAGETKLPMRVSLLTIAANFVLNLVLIWPLQEAGLAWATSITATAQCLVLAWLAAKRFGGDEVGAMYGHETRRGIVMIVIGAAVMGAVIFGTHLAWPLAAEPSWLERTLALARDTLVGLGAFGAFALITSRPELKWLLERNAGGVAADFG